MTNTENRPTELPDPTPLGEFRAKLGPIDLTAKFPIDQTRNLLPLAGVVACLAGPPLIVYVGYMAGILWWISLLVALVQVCGTAYIVKRWRT